MSYFGEIVEPSSRAVWDDGDSDGDVNVVKLQWCDEAIGSKLGVSEVKLLIIIDGPIIADYIHRQVLIGCGYQPMKKTVGKNIEIFQLPEQVLVCLCWDSDLLRSSEIVELLQDYIKIADDVLAIQLQPLSTYCTNTPPNSSSFIRIIGTERCKNFSNVKHLEQPNIISGVSAGVLSYRQFIDKEAAVYVCYIDNPQLDSINVREINRLLDNFNIEYNKVYHPMLAAKSNLYL